MGNMPLAQQTEQETLWTAAQKNDVDLFREILQKPGETPKFTARNCTKSSICYLVSYLAMDGDIEILKILHEYGAEMDVNDGSTGDTPFMRALFSQEIETAEFLAENGTSPFKGNNFGVRNFIVASGMGSPKIIETMVEKGASVNMPQTMPDMVGNTKTMVDNVTPLMVAAGYGRPDLVETLIRLGASSDSKDSLGRAPMDYGRTEDIKKIISLALEEKNDRR